MPEEDNEPSYKVSILGDGVSIDRSVSANLAEAIIAMIFGGQTMYVAGSNGARQPAKHDPKVGERRLSIREYLDESGATKNAEKITAIAEYLHAEEGADLFTWEDIKSRFKPAGEGAPANFPRDFSVALKQGWVAEDPKNGGSYYVTKTGRGAIESNFGHSRPAKRTQDLATKPDASTSKGAAHTSRRKSGNSKGASWRMVDDLLDTDGREALKNFFASKRPTTQNDQVSVLAFKLKELTGRDGFDGHEIHTAFQIVGSKTPGNLSGVFGNMTGAGLGRVVEKKFVPNFKAEDRVKHDLPGKDSSK